MTRLVYYETFHDYLLDQSWGSALACVAQGNATSELVGLQRTRRNLASYMTIAAGFNFKGGILICSDTKFARQQKMLASKIFRKEHSNGARTVIAIAGNMKYGRMGMQAIEGAISNVPPAECTTERMVRELISTISLLHREFIFKHPDRPSVAYVICLWSPVDHLALLSTEDTAVIKLPGYDFVGSGEYLAHYLIRSEYKKMGSANAPLKKVKALVLKALRAIKSYDDACGGRSEYITIMENGEMSPVETVDIRPLLAS